MCVLRVSTVTAQQKMWIFELPVFSDLGKYRYQYALSPNFQFSGVHTEQFHYAYLKIKESIKESGYNTQVYPPMMSSLHCQQPSLPFQLTFLYL